MALATSHSPSLHSLDARGFLRAANAFFIGIAARRAYSELNRMSDSQLDAIGITRKDISDRFAAIL